MFLPAVMNSHSLTGAHAFPFYPSLPIRRAIINVTDYNHFPLPPSWRFTLHRLCKIPNIQVVCCSIQENRMLEPEDAALLISTCITRNLSPALTLEQGLEKIKEAVEELKAKPPFSSSGMFRFQVAVPPSAKSLNWFCCQPESSGVFPQFFLSKERQDPLVLSNHTRGIFGIGAAISWKGFSANKEYGEFGRCCAVESTPVVAYGFLDLSFDMISSSMKQEAGLFYFFVPQIELAEFEGASILSAMVAWNDTCICIFEEALKACESSILQAERNFRSFEDGCCSNHISATVRKVHVQEGQVQMVCANLHKPFGKDVGPGAVELKDASCYSSQFVVRLSPALAISNNMEPVKDEDDIIKFCEETGLTVALDETINSIRKNHLKVLAKYTHPMIVAFVIKPSVVGGFENAALLARWAHQQGKMAVISATFESSLGLSALILFSRYVDLMKLDTGRMFNKEENSCIAHGLGTYQWLRQDVSRRPLMIGYIPSNGVEASVTDAAQNLQHFQFNQDAIVLDCTSRGLHAYEFVANLEGTSICLNVQEIGKNNDSSVVVFLHGFLGTGEDWISIMKAISGSARCIAVDLPGHGRSKLLGHDYDSEEPGLSIMAFAKILQQLLDSLQCRKVVLVGYSMGARIALYMALRCDDKVAGAVIISGSPGLIDEEARKVRRAKDDFSACFLASSGLECFLDAWYSGDLWTSLRTHPHFNKILASRLQHCDLKNLRRVLADLSVGRQPPLWQDLKSCRVPLQFIVGEKDVKFKNIAQKMRDTMCQSTETINVAEIVEIPYSGHAAHIENPLSVISAISRFIREVEFKSL